MNQLSIYNTLHNKKEPFVPLEEGKVKMYVCGPTTYNYIHLGNARPIVVFDTVRRYFEYLGYDVTYISNFTDVDDKIIKRSHEEHKSAKEVAETYIKAYFEDIDALGVRHATAHPRVSEHMDDIIAFVKGLVEKGHAYEAKNGDVYYRVRSFEDYGKLSGRNLDEMHAGARVAIEEEKEDPMDFALWKHAKEGEPAWQSPWGEGRPGWHIECSAMSKKLLGDEFDIHGGGQDLIFPHHENEIAQSCALTGCDHMAHYWMHNGFITINEEKMSKSKGNFFLLREILARFPADVVRFYLLSVHYRSPLDFDDDKIAAAARGLERLQGAYHALKEARKAAQDADRRPGFIEALDAAENAFKEAMNDDFNTAGAFAALFDLVRTTNTYLRETPLYKQDIDAALALYDRLLDVLGIPAEKNEAPQDDLTDGLLALLIDIRAEARANKDWTTSDKIRDALKDLGIELLDGKDGTTWQRA